NPEKKSIEYFAKILQKLQSWKQFSQEPTTRLNVLLFSDSDILPRLLIYYLDNDAMNDAKRILTYIPANSERHEQLASALQKVDPVLLPVLLDKICVSREFLKLYEVEQNGTRDDPATKQCCSRWLEQVCPERHRNELLTIMLNTLGMSHMQA